MRGACLAAIAVAALPPSAARAADEGPVIDRVIALVSSAPGTVGRTEQRADLITLSDLQFEGAVALIQAGGKGAATEALDGPALQRALEYAIAQRLATREAEALQAFQLDEGEAEQALAAFAAKFDSPQAFERFLARFEADRTWLLAVLGRQLRAEKIFDSRVRLAAQVSEADVRRAYDARASELNAPYEQVRGPLREALVRERYAQLVAAEIARMRRGADVRIVTSPEEAAR